MICVFVMTWLTSGVAVLTLALSMAATSTVVLLSPTCSFGVMTRRPPTVMVIVVSKVAKPVLAAEILYEPGSRLVSW